MSEAGWIKIAELIIAFLGATLTALLAFFVMRMGQEAKITKKLVNSAMEVQLRLYAESTAREAANTNTDADIQRALEAKKAHDAHVVQQAKIDSE